MPLHILLILVIGGIAGIGALLHVLGHSTPFAIDSDATARREWARHLPEDSIATVEIAESGRAALVLTDAGPGLLRSFGADTVAHRITRAAVAKGGLRLWLTDFGAPPVRVALTPAEALRWRSLLTSEAGEAATA